MPMDAAVAEAVLTLEVVLLLASTPAVDVFIGADELFVAPDPVVVGANV